jgi:hypothetical protein
MNLEAILEYMRATIRARNPRDIERWTVREVVAAFNTIPAGDKVDFETWSARMSDNPPPAAEAPATAPSEEEMIAQNEKFLGQVGQMFPALKERLDDEAAAAKVAAVA